MTRAAIIHSTVFLILSKFGLAQENTLNDQCDKALSIEPGDIVFGSTTEAFAPDDNRLNLVRCADDGSFDIGNPGLWYVYTAQASRILQLSTCAEQTNFQNRITTFVLEGGNCEDKSCAASSIEEDPNCPFSNSSFLELSVTEGITYHLFVHDRFVENSGNFALNITDVTEPPENDSCDKAENLVIDEILQGTTVGASNREGLDCSGNFEGGAQNPGVFYSIPPFEEQTNVTVSIVGVNSAFDGSVFASCGELNCTEIESEKDDLTTTLSWTVEAGEEFYVKVFAVENSDGSMTPATGRFGILMTKPGGMDAESTSAASIIGTGSLFLAILQLCQTII